MDRRRVLTVCKKELRETLRDRRTIVAVLLLPPLLYPLLAILAVKLGESRRAEYTALPTRVVLTGDEIPSLRAHLASTPDVSFPPAAPAPEGAVIRGDADVEVHVAEGGAAAFAGGGTAPVDLRWDAASERSAVGRDRLEEALGAFSAAAAEDRLVEAGLAPELASPIVVAPHDVAPPERLGGSVLARVAPALLVMFMMVGALYPAIDLTVGEKERGTLEVLLAAPVEPTEVVAGKFLAVAATAMVSGLVNVASMAFTVGSILAQADAVGATLSIALAPATAAALFGALALVALFFAALMMAVAAPARTLKEAQAYVMPVYLACMVPALLANLGGFELTPAIALVPILGLTLLVKSLFLGDVPWLAAAVALAAAAGHAAAALWFAARAFTREQTLFGAPPEPALAVAGGGGSEGGTGGARGRLAAFWGSPGAPAPRMAGHPGGAGGALPPKRAALSLVEAVVLALVVVVLMLTIGGILQLRLGTLGFALSEWVLLPVPVVLAIRFLHVDPVTGLSLRLPTGRAVAGALLVGATAWYPAMLATMALAPLVRPDTETLRMLEELVTAPSDTWITVAVFAVSPAVCEELLFRGALLAAFRTRMAAPGAVLLAALLFAAFHQPAFRMAPTFVLGLLFGYAVWRSGSLAAGVLCHLLNNALVVLVSTYGASPTDKELAGAMTEAPVPWHVGAGILVVLALGVWTLWSSAREPGDLTLEGRV
jgi:sodium transport system permease protein